MGIWAPKSFANDQALDLLLSLESLGDGESLVSALRKVFDNYASYEHRRKSKTNTYILTDEWARHSLAKAACSVEDTEYLYGILSTSFGKEQIDTGDTEAYEAVAAAEIIIAKASGDYSQLGDDGEFLKSIHCDVTGDDIASAKAAIESVLLNKQLLNQNGAAWTRNTVRVLERISTYAPR